MLVVRDTVIGLIGMVLKIKDKRHNKRYLKLKVNNERTHTVVTRTTKTSIVAFLVCQSLSILVSLLASRRLTQTRTVDLNFTKLSLLRVWRIAGPRILMVWILNNYKCTIPFDSLADGCTDSRSDCFTNCLEGLHRQELSSTPDCGF